MGPACGGQGVVLYAYPGHTGRLGLQGQVGQILFPGHHVRGGVNMKVKGPVQQFGGVHDAYPRANLGSHRVIQGTKVTSISMTTSTTKKGSMPLAISSMVSPLMADPTNRE